MSGVELQERQGKTVEQKSVSDETRLDNKLKELGDLEKEIFSGDGIVDGQSSDTAIDESYKEGLIQAKTIQQKIDFIESLVLEFQHERKLQELFQKQEKSPYVSQGGAEKLQEGKQKIQGLFQKYPDFKEGIVTHMAGKFLYLDDMVKFYENPKNWGTNSTPGEQKGVCEALINNIWFLEELGDLEKTLVYIQKNTSIENKKDFLKNILMWNPDEIYNVGEKMEVISQLSFYQKEGGYKYAISMMTTKVDTNLSELLKIDTQKLQKLDTFFQKGDDEGFRNYIKEQFSTTDMERLFVMPSVRDKYLQIEKLKIGNIASKLSEKIILDLAVIKDKSLFGEIQNILGKIVSIQDIDEKIMFVSQFVQKELLILLQKSKYLADNYKIIDIVGEVISDIGANQREGTDIYEKLYIIYKELDNKNKEKGQIYIDKKIVYFQSLGKDTPTDLLQQIKKIDSGTEHTQDSFLLKLRLIEDEEAKQSIQTPTKTPEPTQSPETSPAKIPEMQKSLSRLGLNVKVSENGSIVGVNGETNFTQKIGNRTFEINDNGQIITQGAFGYNFKYENNLNGIEKYLEIADQIEYVDHMGLGHFGENLKEMISILNLYTSYTGLRYINIDDTTTNSTDFINQVELTNISKAFHKIGFLSNENFSYSFKSGEMQKVEFTHIMETKFEGKNFFKGGTFDREMFKKTITETQWQK